MKAEIIAVGTELLLGDVVNTNAAWISRELAGLGIDVFYHVTVGDNPARIKSVIEQAVSRSDVLIFTGGLGPTEDDLTVAAIADYFNVPLVSDPDSEKTIRDFFIARGMKHSPSNLKQALRPEDAVPIPNPVGTAPGIFWDVSARTGKPTVILTFPGVPKELYLMWERGRELLLSRQEKDGESRQVLVTRFLHFFGIGESLLGERLSDLMAGDSPTVAPYVGRSEVRVRLAAKAATENEALALIEPVRNEIIRRLEKHYIGEGESATLESAVASLLFDKGLSVAAAESCTGGLVSSRLTDVPGSSEYTLLNVVTYSNEQKTQMLGVSPETLETFGAVSPQTAAEMARGVRRLAGTDIGISLTGIAGPTGGTDDKPVGLVYIGLCGLGADADEAVVKKTMVNHNYKREDVKHWFSQYALNFLRLYLMGRLKPDREETPESPEVNLKPV